MNPADHIGLVGSIAKRYGQIMPYEDLVQSGVIGLLRAVEKFEPERGFTFANYAQWWIRQAITRSIQNTAKTIRLPVHVHLKLRRAGEDAPREPLSLDAPLSLDDDGTLHDILPDERVATPEDLASTAQLHSILREQVATLSERERTILRMRFEDELTLKEVGARLGCSRERVRQIQVEVFEKLRKRMEPLCAW